MGQDSRPPYGLRGLRPSPERQHASRQRLERCSRQPLIVVKNLDTIAVFVIYVEALAIHPPNPTT